MTAPHSSFALPVDVPPAMADAMAGLAVDALTSLSAQVDAVEAVAVRALHGPVPAGDEERQEALHCAHRVAGTAGAFAWHATSALLQQAEVLLGREQDLDVDAAVRLCELVMEARDDLARPPFTGTAPPELTEGVTHLPAASGVQRTTPAPVRPSTVDVVVVEDDAILSALLCRVVTDLGLTVAVAEDGVSALGLLAGAEPLARPRLVLLDIDLPGRSGLSVLRVLQRDGVTDTASVVMLSSRSGAADRDQAAQLGATAFLSKPFAIRDVVARLQGLVDTAAPR